MPALLTERNEKGDWTLLQRRLDSLASVAGTEKGEGEQLFANARRERGAREEGGGGTCYNAIVFFVAASN